MATVVVVVMVVMIESTVTVVMIGAVVPAVPAQDNEEIMDCEHLSGMPLMHDEECVHYLKKIDAKKAAGAFEVAAYCLRMMR